LDLQRHSRSGPSGEIAPLLDDIIERTFGVRVLGCVGEALGGFSTAQVVFSASHLENLMTT
jgi:hypothetical protein